MSASQKSVYGYVVSSLSGERVRAYVPPPLPPRRGLELEKLQAILAEANQAIGRLNGTARALPDLHLFLYSYIRKEAVLSSQIEGTQSSLADLLLYEKAETPGVPLDDVKEVSNYVAALNHGLKRMRGGFPLSLRLLQEIHKVLLSKVRGSHAQPGEFRKSQNWIGGSRPGNAVFVPPPPERLMECLDSFERFLHAEDDGLPLLVRAGIAHAQFETIHPFLDGNGRVGRLLITFLLCARDALQEPVLYLSLYFKKHRQLYYDRLNGTREKDGWTGWLDFFLQGVRDTANLASETSVRIEALFREDEANIAGFGRASASALGVFRNAQRSPILTIHSAAKDAKVTFPTASKAIERLASAGILHEKSGRARDRLFVYERYLKLLNEGMESPEA